MKTEIEIISSAFSSQRIGRYLRLYHENEEQAIAHYKANLAVAESLYTSLSVFEVTLRNALSKEMERMMGRKDWYCVLSTNNTLKGLSEEVSVAIKHITNKGENLTPDKVVAELTFGFWVTLLNNEYETALWKGLRLAFPNMPKAERKRKNVSAPCNALRKLRNRVFHHEAICWDLNYLMNMHGRLVEVLGWMNKDMPTWLADVDHFEAVCDEIKQSPLHLKL